MLSISDIRNILIYLFIKMAATYCRAFRIIEGHELSGLVDWRSDVTDMNG